MRKVLIIMRSGLAYSTDDYNIRVGYLTSKSDESVFLDIKDLDDVFFRSWYDYPTTLYFITDKESIIRFKGNNVESITVFN